MDIEELGFKGKKEEKLNKDYISTTAELLYKQPRKYYDFRSPLPIQFCDEIRCASDIKTPVVLTGTAISVVLDHKPGEKMSVIKIKIQNPATKDMLYLNIFGEYNMFDFYKDTENSTVYVGGIIKWQKFGTRDILSMGKPYLYTTKEEDLKIYPVYRKYKGISEDFYLKALDKAEKNIEEDYIPDSISHLPLMTYQNTVHALHHPIDMDELTEAEKRMTFDQMLYFISKMEESEQNISSDIKPQKNEVMQKFISSLPYKLTDDQQSAINTLSTKMQQKQTSALIQGDVSCGKTIVAFCLMILMAENGYQSVLLAPTLILARQHYEEMSKYADQLRYKAAFLSSELTAKQQKAIAEHSDEYQFFIGTRSCFSKNMKYNHLGLVITDEEHKFGVVQKKFNTGEGIHTVMMSATPIPRTIACSLYGNNMEVITIKQMPNGRLPIQTAICKSDKPVFTFAEKVLAEKHQVYVVCPLIDEAEDGTKMEGISSVEDVGKRYKEHFESLGYKVGVITGKTSPDEQQEMKKMFAANTLQILIATTVIEVGINVPNATLMIIQSAERFGLATLHQLRGRVGRGSVQSYCILQKTNADIESDNLDILLHETDGFEIAKADLKNRKSGSLLGTQQSGHNRFIDMLIEYPALYESVKKIAVNIESKEREDFIEKYEELYPMMTT